MSQPSRLPEGGLLACRDCGSTRVPQAIAKKLYNTKGAQVMPACPVCELKGRLDRIVQIAEGEMAKRSQELT